MVSNRGGRTVCESSQEIRDDRQWTLQYSGSNAKAGRETEIINVEKDKAEDGFCPEMKGRLAVRRRRM